MQSRGNPSYNARLLPYTANLCPLSGGVEFAGFHDDFGQSVRELVEAAADLSFELSEDDRR
jgi:hypothetical protein